jgi:hypothetical protein
MSRDQTTTTARHRKGRPMMAAELGRHLAGEERPSSADAVAVPLHAAGTGATALDATRAVLGVVTLRDQHSLTVDVRRGGPRPDGDGEHLITYRVAGTSTRVYKGGHRTTLDEIAVGDLVLVHTLVALTGTQDAAPVTAARIHGLTPSRRALGA